MIVLSQNRPEMSLSQRDRSWVLINDRDFWSGRIDSTTFVPLSAKSEGDFDDILAADMPDAWATGRPFRGSATGRML